MVFSLPSEMCGSWLGLEESLISSPYSIRVVWSWVDTASFEEI
jgi:hypothetical protein